MLFGLLFVLLVVLPELSGALWLALPGKFCCLSEQEYLLPLLGLAAGSPMGLVLFTLGGSEGGLRY